MLPQRGWRCPGVRSVRRIWKLRSLEREKGERRRGKKKIEVSSHMNKHEPGPERRGGRRVGSNAGHVSDARQSSARCHENVKF